MPSPRQAQARCFLLPRFGTFGDSRPQRRDGLRPERAAARDASLRPGVADPASVQVEGRQGKCGDVVVAEAGIDAASPLAEVVDLAPGSSSATPRMRGE